MEVERERCCLLLVAATDGGDVDSRNRRREEGSKTYHLFVSTPPALRIMSSEPCISANTVADLQVA